MQIGINHNASINLAKLIDLAVKYNFDAVKFQKEIQVSTPEFQKIFLEKPQHYIFRLQKIEFGIQEYKEIDKYCKKIDWFVSSWDLDSKIYE